MRSTVLAFISLLSISVIGAHARAASAEVVTSPLEDLQMKLFGKPSRTAPPRVKPQTEKSPKAAKPTHPSRTNKPQPKNAKTPGKVSASPWPIDVPETAAPSAPKAPRPPQFVMLAFDGSKSIDMWKETRQYTKDLEARGMNARFIYFINPAYLIASKNKKMYVPQWNRAIYDAPQVGPGVSAIGFACGAAPTKELCDRELANRQDQISLAYTEGHEIASHAVGHFDADGGRAGGKKYLPWSVADWRSEHKQFFDLLFNALGIQGIRPLNNGRTGLAFGRAQITGFRAPQLGRGIGFDQALAEQNFVYDTSRQAEPNYWPERLVATRAWNFPLASIPMYRPVGGHLVSIGHSLAMDYNFCASQTQHETGKVTGDCKTFPGITQRLRDEMYQSYMQYFMKLYTGNRAPIQIGHHFSKWNNGAYWDAMRMFTESVCGLPEVRCVTYQEYVAWLEALTPDTLRFYRTFRGSWGKKPAQLELLKIARENTPTAKLSMIDDTVVPMLSPGARAAGYGTKITVARQTLAVNERVSLTSLRSALAPTGLDHALMTIEVVNKDGQTISSRDQVLRDVRWSTIRLEKEAAEEKFNHGDMPEAHLER